MLTPLCIAPIRPGHVAESEELDSDSSTATQPTRVASDEEEKHGEGLGGSGEESEEEEELLDFTQTDYASQQVSERSDPSEAQEREGGKAKTPTMPAKVAQLSDKAVDDLTAQLVRYMLYKGGLKLPIKFGDISKDVYPTYKNVSRFFFHRAKKQLESVFGYQVVPVDDSTSKEVYLVINATSSQEHWQLLNKTGKSPARGLLMMVLGLLWCATGRRLSEGKAPLGILLRYLLVQTTSPRMTAQPWHAEDLWKQLERVDSRVKENREHPQLGDVSQLMKTFETQMFVLVVNMLVVLVLLES